MASNAPLELIDGDDDEFDWEAAVREIDKACENTKPSTPSEPKNQSFHFPSSPSVVGIPSGFCSNGQKKPSRTSMQSTLDRFIWKVGPGRPPAVNHLTVQDGDPECVVVEGDERVACIDIDSEAAKTWIYPVNVPLRDYQFAITRTALFSNTLVALPTGLGKTLIAAVVMYNYFRWFPDGKIVFAAPSRPLVMQQIEACHNIVGIPQEWTIDMTGQINPARRACLWRSKRVFFVTPQVLEKDIQSGICLVKYLVCLVIDEAHRALGNYSYCVVVRELMAISLQLRILALTATPGSKQQGIQQIINNLCISTLEYRNESDHDVSPYVHNRKIELIEVALGREAVEINNQLLEVIHPYVARLHTAGVLQNRDYQTLSPVDLLNSRDKFRQAPPLDLPHVKHGEVEASFAALITLYHIRRLLSSHGIRPAYEMLEEKLQHGAFSRLMSKNEDIMKVKLLMLRSLSHGAPSPKLSKMLEVLVDHFKLKNPTNSRVIIFSNFRGSVRDIMNALASIGDFVKATEFIGQSSGKALKGQSQKVQQAVLEKFRAGGYNVIVATSIGEEGLDIMEVDLVICFDANVSPLRMIQRMGRTGRKHDGRVVVLACQGSELKGYMRKQANSRAIKKHMRNGGLNSFNFHSSPRMIPHAFKPEVQFVELSIEQFVRRGKKLIDENSIQTPLIKEKLTDAETDLIAKYFQPTIEKALRPSLIAFPNFQALPSKVHKVMHSCRTGMLIDSMQYLQGLTFMGGIRTLPVKDEVSSVDCLGVDIASQHDNARKDLCVLDDSSAAYSQRDVMNLEISPLKTLRTKEKHVPCSNSKSLPAHSYLFSSDFVSVDALGKVQVLSIPSLHFEQIMHSKHFSHRSKELPNSLKLDSSNLKTSDCDYHEPTMQAKGFLCTEDDTVLVSRSCKFDSWTEKILDGAEKTLKSGALNGDSSCETPNVDAIKLRSPLADEYSNDVRESELSPRLTNLIKSGVVPESPVTDSRISNNKERNESLFPGLASPAKFGTTPLIRSSSPVKTERCNMDNTASRRNVVVSSTPLIKMNNVSSTRSAFASPGGEEAQTPSAKLADNSGSCSWHLSSGEKSRNVKQGHKYKRLRKIGDKGSSLVPVANLVRSFSAATPKQQRDRGKKQLKDDAKIFFDEEPEVSSEAEIWDDEDDEDDDSYDESFIDDRINASALGTQSESGRVDMMAIYRRSLLSQSPMGRRPSSCVFSRDSVGSFRVKEVETSLRNRSYSFMSPQTEFIDKSAGRDTESLQTNRQVPSEALPSRNIDLSMESDKLESRKRKLSFLQAGSLPAINLDKEYSCQSKHGGEQSFLVQSEKLVANEDQLDDDQFYEGLDLDAVEAQATLLLKHHSESLIQKQEVIVQSNLPNNELQGSPSFDLGIW